MRRLFEAWDRDGFGAVPEAMDPAIEFVNPPYAVEPGIRTGFAGFDVAAENLRAAYPSWRWEPLEFRHSGNRVAVRARAIARGAGSSVEVITERGYAFEVRDGKVIRFAWFNHPAEAFEAVALQA